jgi:hypothetical protein
MLEIPIENVNALLQVRHIEALMTFPTSHARFVVRIMRHKFPRSTSPQSTLVRYQPSPVSILGSLHSQLPPSNIINIDLLVITRISIFVKLDIIIHTLVAISATPLASILPCLTEEMHTYQFR